MDVRCLTLGEVSDRISCYTPVSGLAQHGEEGQHDGEGLEHAPGGVAEELDFIFVSLEWTLGTSLAAALGYWRACGCPLTNPSWLRCTGRGQEAAVLN